jgi:arabinogalactan oligomer/maltooligosaccharide transport system permease protein
MVVATGALQSIPRDMYEAADVDGASKWRQFWSITVPLIRPAMVPAIMLGTIWTFNGFAVIYFITGGGPSRKTEILVPQSYNLLQETSLAGRYGVAAAFSLVVFAILLVITVLNNRITRATEAYDA